MGRTKADEKATNRFQMIAPLLNEELDQQERGRLLKQVASHHGLSEKSVPVPKTIRTIKIIHEICKINPHSFVGKWIIIKCVEVVWGPGTFWESFPSLVSAGTRYLLGATSICNEMK